MKEYDKRKSHISSKLHVICIYSNNDSHTVTNSCNMCRNTMIFSTLQRNTKQNLISALDHLSTQNFSNSRMITTHIQHSPSVRDCQHSGF